MNERIIKSQKELPDWFKLEHYANAETLSAEEWYQELQVRFSLRSTLVHIKALGDGSEFVPRIWEDIKGNGLITSLNRDQITILSAPRAFSFTDRVSQHFEKVINPPLKTLSNGDIYSCYWRDPNREEIDKRMQIAYGNRDTKLDDDTIFKNIEWFHTPYSVFPQYKDWGIGNGYVYVRIDLNASDEEVKKDFDEWLAKERERRNEEKRKKNFTQLDFASWHESAVLPYLDLIFWSGIENIRINQYVIAQALFPNACALGSDMDPLGKLKTTKKKAEYLMNFDILKALELQLEFKLPIDQAED